MQFFDEQEIFLVPDESELNFTQKAKSADKEIVILLSKNEQKKELIALLNKICTAAGFNFDQEVSIISIEEKSDIRLSQFFTNQKNTPVISFGNFENQLVTQFHKTKYEWINLNDNIVLFCDTLESISTDQDKKRRLWAAMVKQFK